MLGEFRSERFWGRTRIVLLQLLPKSVQLQRKGISSRQDTLLTARVSPSSFLTKAVRLIT